MLYVLVVLALIAADQGLKYWTVSHLAVGQSAPLLPGIMRLTRLHNYGAAWSSLSGKTALLIAVTAALLVGVFVLLVRRIVRHPLGVAGCLLILGGGHVPTQNRFFQKIGLRERMKAFAGLVIGISAGSMNSAEIVYAHPELEGEAIDLAYPEMSLSLGFRNWLHQYNCTLLYIYLNTRIKNKPKCSIGQYIKIKCFLF